MITLPNENQRNPLNEKIATYQFLAEMHCPVFMSILLDENEELTKEAIVYAVTKCKNPKNPDSEDYLSCKARNTGTYDFDDLAEDIAETLPMA